MPSLFMASFMAVVCAAALSWVVSPLRMDFPMSSTGLQQLDIFATKGWSLLVRLKVSF